MLTIYIDNNCINARRNDEYLNKLDLAFKEDKIAIEKTSVLDTEFSKGHGYQAGLEKSLDYIESYETFILGEIRLGHGVFGIPEEQELYEKLLLMFFDKKSAGKYTDNEKADIRHLMTVIKYRGHFFITYDKELLSRSSEFEREFNIKIKTPKDCWDEIRLFI